MATEQSASHRRCPEHILYRVRLQGLTFYVLASGAHPAVSTLTGDWAHPTPPCLPSLTRQGPGVITHAQVLALRILYTLLFYVLVTIIVLKIVFGTPRESPARTCRTIASYRERRTHIGRYN